MAEGDRVVFDWHQYDAIDLGCAHGNTVRLAREAFGAKKVLGIDRRGVHRKDAQAMKFGFLKTDVLEMFLPANCCRFVTMGHFLEHLPTEFCVDRTLAMSWGACTDFVFATNPAWDCVERLLRNRLKFYWQDWADHTTPVTTRMVHDILSDMGIGHVIFAGGHTCHSAKDPDMHSLKSPNGVAHYDPSKHPPKPQVAFVPAVFREMTVFAWKDRLAWSRWRPMLDKMYSKQQVMYEEVP